jgi:hypothetical protein
LRSPDSQAAELVGATESAFVSIRDQPILVIVAVQRTGTSAMAQPKALDQKSVVKREIPALTIGTFVQAAIVANLIVGTLVFVEFSVMSLVNRDGRDFKMGLWLVPFVTLVIWGTASVMCVVALIPRWLSMFGRWLIGEPARSSPSDKLGVWDDWLDSPAEAIVPASIIGELQWERDHEVSNP